MMNQMNMIQMKVQNKCKKLQLKNRINMDFVNELNALNLSVLLCCNGFGELFDGLYQIYKAAIVAKQRNRVEGSTIVKK